jgi:ribosomal protein L11 methylase PrmA
MNIYSIEEIIKASNFILKKKDAPFYNNVELNNVKKTNNEKKPLLIQNKDFIKRVPVIIHNVNKDELLDKLYNFFKNKVNSFFINYLVFIIF